MERKVKPGSGEKNFVMVNLILWSLCPFIDFVFGLGEGGDFHHKC
jgi:hypothetical protein